MYKMYKMYKMYEMYKRYEMYKMSRCIRCTKDMRKYETDGRYSSQYNFHNTARSRQLARDLFPWYKKRQETCIGSLTIGSSTLLKTK